LYDGILVVVTGTLSYRVADDEKESDLTDEKSGNLADENNGDLIMCSFLDIHHHPADHNPPLAVRHH
jgi:hypothetical protein